jgi:hypothetical protein
MRCCLARARPRALLRSVALAALVLLALGCDPEDVPATQTTVRIDATPEVRAAMSQLRVRTSASRGGSWQKRNDRSFPLDQLEWPVDVVITPRAESAADEQFELIAEALDQSDMPLVQARVLTGFVRRRQRTLTLLLSACADMPLGNLCEGDPECYGPSCLTCIEGRCVETPLTAPESLTPLTPDAPDGGADSQSPIVEDEGGITPIEKDGGDGALVDGGLDGGLDSGMEADGMTAPPDADSGLVACDPGSERNASSVCVDIDECARGTDDCDREPKACVNTMNGFACACSTGFRGTGRGQDGCVDIDECTEGTDSCDALAMCNNTPGGYACGSCPSGYSPGAGGTCTDINECTSANGGCDTSPMATCNNQLGMPNTCTCPSGYTGNGVGTSGCADINECMSNNGGCDTSPMASCGNRVGLPNTCACPAGYAGNGVGANGCTDPCSPNPCGTGFTCTRSAQATAVCGATCAISGGPGCLPGDKCATDADCRTRGDSTATCDATDKVCTNICPETTISDPIHLTSSRYCREINGKLTLNPPFAEIASTEFPYLTRVRGDLVVGSIVNNVTRSITLSALRTIDGTLAIANSLMLNTVSLPRLTTVGANVSMAQLTALQRLSMPQLSSVTGNFALVGLSALVQLDVNSLTAAGGSMTFFLLCRLPSTQVSRFTGAAFTNVGCCTSSTTQINCTAGACSCN